MKTAEKYLTEGKRTYNQLVKSLDYVIDNIKAVDPSAAEKKVLNQMITALQRKLK